MEVVQSFNLALYNTKKKQLRDKKIYITKLISLKKKRK